jgi:hypothetical protein
VAQHDPWPDQYKHALNQYLDKHPVLDDPQVAHRLLRCSSVSSADLCPGRVVQATAEDFDHRTAEPMFFGTVAHHLNERFMLGKPTPLSRIAVWTAAEECAQDDGFDSFLSLLPAGDQRQAWVDELLNAHMLWRQAWGAWCGQWATVTTAVVEQPLVTPIVRSLFTQWWLGGTPDLVVNCTTKTGEPVVYGLDWKTANRGWAAGKAQASPQHKLYSHLLLTNGLPAPTAWSYLVYNRQSKRWDEHPVISTAAAVAAVLNACDGLTFMVTDEVPWYTPRGNDGKRGWHCTPEYCGAWELCPGRFLGDDKDTLHRVGSGWEKYTSTTSST